MTAYIRNVFNICHQWDISCGSFVDGPELIARYRDLGGNVFWTGSEIGMLCTGYKILCDTFNKETTSVDIKEALV